jgi:hypothetical protein
VAAEASDMGPKRHALRRHLIVMILLMITMTGCGFVYDLVFFYAGPEKNGFLGDILIEIIVDDPESDVALNQSHLLEGDVEFSLGVRIDVDGDPATGDADGFDVDLRLFWVTDADPPWSGTLASLAGGDQFTHPGAGYPSVDVTPYEVDGYRASYFVGGAVYIEADSGEPMFAVLSDTPRSQFYATYNAPADRLVQDEDTTDMVSGSDTVTDTVGDVPHGFIDIVSARIVFP